MQRSLRRFSFLLWLLLCLFVSLEAKDSRSFAGFYQSEKMSEQGDLVQVKLSLRVFNYSRAEVRNASVFLADPLLDPPSAQTKAERERPSFEGVTLHVNARKSADLAGTFTLPARMYREWLSGMHPPFMVSYSDQNGKSHREQIELTRLP